MRSWKCRTSPLPLCSLSLSTLSLCLFLSLLSLPTGSLFFFFLLSLPFTHVPIFHITAPLGFSSLCFLGHGSNTNYVELLCYVKNSPHWTVGQITLQLPRAHRTASFCCLQSNLIVSTDTLFLPENDITQAHRKTHSSSCFCLLLRHHMQTLSLLMFYRLFLQRGGHRGKRFTTLSVSLCLHLARVTLYY